MCINEAATKREYAKRVLTEASFLVEVAEAANNLEDSRRTLQKLKEKLLDAIKTINELSLK